MPKVTMGTLTIIIVASSRVRCKNAAIEIVKNFAEQFLKPVIHRVLGETDERVGISFLDGKVSSYSVFELSADRRFARGQWRALVKSFRSAKCLQASLFLIKS